MKGRLVLAYQLLTGLSDTCTGLLLLFAPAVTLRLMRLHETTAVLPFLSYIGAFVLSTGLACLYGAALAGKSAQNDKLETVWLLTAITRSLVAIYVVTAVVTGKLEPGWMTVALTDGILALLQFIGLARKWPHNG